MEKEEKKIYLPINFLENKMKQNAKVIRSVKDDIQKYYKVCKFSIGHL